jgi:hypothetical protein
MHKLTLHQYCVFVDEFQHFATDDFADLILEGRKFGSAITIAHRGHGFCTGSTLFGSRFS